MGLHILVGERAKLWKAAQEEHRNQKVRQKDLGEEGPRIVAVVVGQEELRSQKVRQEDLGEVDLRIVAVVADQEAVVCLVGRHIEEDQGVVVCSVVEVALPLVGRVAPCVPEAGVHRSRPVAVEDAFHRVRVVEAFHLVPVGAFLSEQVAWDLEERLALLRVG